MFFNLASPDEGLVLNPIHFMITSKHLRQKKKKNYKGLSHIPWQFQNQMQYRVFYFIVFYLGC